MPQLIVAPLTTFFGGLSIAGFGLSATAAGIAANLTASLLFSAASRALSGGNRQSQSQSDLVRSLAYPTSIPPKRTASGFCRVPGSGAPGWVVNNGILYGCYILNSRPSDGGAAVIYLDKREVTLTGDLFDFATGASASNSPFAGYAKFWMGLGDQSGPPAQIMAEFGDVTSTDDTKFWPSDKWTGRTVLWARFDRGPNDSRAERWPSAPPQVEVEARWTKVWDMRDGAQDPDDPTTWTYSANQALCLLDAIRQNPIRRRALRQIDMDVFEYAADVADETRALSVGGAEPKWQANGLIVWSSTELIDQLSPLAMAGGGFLYQSGGRLGYAPAAYRAPVAEISDVLNGQPIKFVRTVPGRDIPRAVRGRFVDPAAQWEMSDLVPYPVPGQGGYDGDDDGVETLDLSLVTSATQAMQLQKIKAELAGGQKRLSCELPPENFDLIAGSSVEIAFPRLTDQRNGEYMLTQTHPSVWLQSEDGVAFRVPAEMREISADIWAWDSSEETAVITSTFSPINLALAAPTDLDAAAGASQINFDFDGSGSDAVEFEWQWRRNGGDWVPGGLIDSTLLNGLGRVYGVLLTAAIGSYDFRVRGVRGLRKSSWVSTASPAIIALDLGVPTDGDATGGRARIDIVFTSPNSADFIGMEVYAGPASDGSGATALTAIAYGSANTIFAFAETGLGNSVTRYYFARSFGPDSAASAFTSAVSATTDLIGPGSTRYFADFAAGVYEIDGSAVAIGDLLGLTRAGTATYIDAGGLLQTAAADVRRIDHATGAPCLLIEAAATNLHTYSDDISNASWSTVSVTKAANTVTGPDGGLTGDTLTSGNVAGQGMYDVVTVTPGQTYTHSVWVKLGTMAASDFKMAIRNDTAGSFIATDIVPAVAPTSTGWTRVSVTTVVPAGCTSLRFYPFRNSAAVSGTVHFGNIQTELGAQSSDIVTGASPVTRAADVPTMQGVTDTLDLLATYADASSTAIAAASVSPGYWPTLTKTRLSSLTGIL